MKKYIAVAVAQNSKSSIVSKDEAHIWAAKCLADNPKLAVIHICEVIETAERTLPTIETKQFFCELDEPASKAIAA